jgi:alpha-D-xyloside xylohydrolase
MFQRLSAWVVPILLLATGASAQEKRVVLDRGGSTIVLEPYAPNILRVTLSVLKQPALAPPGYGFTDTPSPAGWSHQQTEQGDTYQSSRLTVTVAANRPGTGKPLPTELDIARYFNGSAPGAHITFTTPEGTRLLDMQGWEMAVPNHKDGTAGVLNDKRPADAAF